LEDKSLREILVESLSTSDWFPETIAVRILST